MRKFIMPLVAAVMLSGCSVGMALSGSENPDLGQIRVGATRGEVELQMGSPVKSNIEESGRRTDVYAYEIGNEPSTGRATSHDWPINDACGVLPSQGR